jgi:hypothetical protein
MPTLNRWFTSEYQRLFADSKDPLAESFETLRSAFFTEDLATVRATLPHVYELTNHFHEPVWRLAADYYAILMEMIWYGNLAKGLDLATQAMIRTSQLLLPGDVLEWYLREVLLDAWLSTDGPGYAADVLAAVAEIDVEGQPVDMRARLIILRAFAETQADPACGGEALKMVMSVLPTLTCWETAYCLRVRAMGLGWADRPAEAARDYEGAVAEFEAMGYRIAANDSRLSLGDALSRAGRVEAGIDVLRAALSAAEHLPNRAQAGMAQGGIGLALIRLERFRDAHEWLSAALDTLSGLGWLRNEAEYALARARISATSAFTTEPHDRHYARQCIERLRSTDLRLTLDTLR